MTSKHLRLLAATSLLALTASTALPAWAAADNTPPTLSRAHDRGVANPAELISITVYLAPADSGAFKAAVDALYDPKSATFHKWLTDHDLKHFAPGPDRIASVRGELEKHGLTVTALQKNGFSITARGNIASIAQAFNTEIHQFDQDGLTFRANIRNARLNEPAGSYVSSVAGIESHVVRPAFVLATNLATGKPYPAITLDGLKGLGGLGKLITDQSLSPSQTYNFNTPGAALPTATYTGIVYNAPGTLTPDFTAHQLQRAYNLDKAYKAGLDGTGQTIVLLEAYGYPTALADANAFSKLNGLPLLTPATFHVAYPQGKPADPNAGIVFGWNVEIALDVQWAHAMAPGAKILVVASNGQDSVDFQAAMQSIIDSGLGYAVSDSWETDTDIFAGPAEQESFENVLTAGAAKGVSFQFSTGDSGDSGLGTPRGAPGVPSVAPHAVAVGGTSILNNPAGAGFLTTAWGIGDVIVDNVSVLDPPPSRLVGGAGGGGESVFWPKPAWQAALPGVGRQTPDISALANPFTGVPIVITDPQTKTQVIQIGIGGTSLASPIFTATWAIADQKAGHPLGQASPLIASLHSGVADVLPVSSPDNTSGSITDANGTTQYATKKLFKGLYNHQQDFLAPIYPLPQLSAAVILGFGLDTSFTVTPGWDNATGYGTVDGLNFINAAASFGTAPR